jgi:aminoglycoside phosphotransferase (APT) family kinase protein
VIVLVFKQDWEKTDQQIELPPSIIERMIRAAFPVSKSYTYDVISGGCANLNIKVTLKDNDETYILRIYLRDKEAPYREQKLASILKNIIPIPQVYFVGDEDPYRFAMLEFLPGITLRDYLLEKDGKAMRNLMKEAGKILLQLNTIQFDSPGFFDRYLFIKNPLGVSDCVDYLKDALQHPIVVETLHQQTIVRVNKLISTFPEIFPNIDDKQLVHCDFDPANILVNQTNGAWHISGILDWEFAFSGSMLWDVANMLRYAHEMPREFEESFLAGLEDGGIWLPNDWRKYISVLNIFSLLGCLMRSDPSLHPRRCADIIKLIEYFIEQIKL